MEKIPYRLRKAIEKQVSKNGPCGQQGGSENGDAQRTAGDPEQKSLPAMQSGGGIRYAFRLLFCSFFCIRPADGLCVRKG